jgi:hypothetical protein
VEDNLKTQPKDFWKYVSRFKNNEHINQLKIGQKVITEPQCIVEAFADYFSTIFNSPSSVVIPNNAQSFTSDFLNVNPLSDYRILFCYTNSIVMDFLNDTSPGSKVICRIDLPSSVP